ncbi:MAG: hypothetical protein ABSD62_14800 [Candidatus Limnocylindrales bacterium]|jgi:hypothetical protein
MTSSLDGKPFSIEFYEENGRKPVLDWIKNDLDADQRRVLGTAMSEILQEQGSGVCESEFGKWADGDIFYFRLRTETGDIFRVYCHQYEGTVILLLHGYDKGGRTAKNWETAQQRIARGRLTKWASDRAVSAKHSKKAAADARSSAGQGPMSSGKGKA